MAKDAKYSVKFRRRRIGKTNYKKRIALIKSGLPRLVVRITNKYVIMQVIKYSPKGDIILASANSKKLIKKKWKHGCKKLPAAYLTGMMLGERIKKKKIKSKLILDSGIGRPNSRIYSAMKGVIDMGINIPHNPKILPSEERISGKHINETIIKDFTKIKEELLKQ